MILAITYSDENYKKSAKLNLFTAKLLGRADKVRLFSPVDIEDDFSEKNKELLSMKRGAGYWVWKPYIIRKALDECGTGDYLMYLDAGAFYVRRIKDLIDNMESLQQNVFLSSSLLPNKDWCKRDAFVKTGCDVSGCVNEHQVEATYILVKKSNEAIRFLKRWLDYACDNQINTDMENILGLPNYVGFRENRHDQTALAMAAYQEGIIGHRGFSDSSEYRIYLRRLNDFGCWQYSNDDLLKMAYDEYTSKGFLESNYKRVIINCRARNQNFYPFAKSVFRSIRSAVNVDLHRERDRNMILNMFENRGGR